jgi:hypothetical protein
MRVYYPEETNAAEVYHVEYMLGYSRSRCGNNVRPQRTVDWTGDSLASRVTFTKPARPFAQDRRLSASAVWRSPDDRPQRRGGSSELLLEHR